VGRTHDDQNPSTVGQCAALAFVREVVVGISDPTLELSLEGIEGLAGVGVALGPEQFDELLGLGLGGDLLPLHDVVLGHQETRRTLIPKERVARGRGRCPSGGHLLLSLRGGREGRENCDDHCKNKEIYSHGPPPWSRQDILPHPFTRRAFQFSILNVEF
jgi:hypothetical protein